MSSTRCTTNSGFGFLESVYRNALRLALLEKGLTVDEEVAVSVFFRGKSVGDFRADLVVNHVFLLELKTAERIVPAHEAQVLNYLRSTSLELGLIKEALFEFFQISVISVNQR